MNIWTDKEKPWRSINIVRRNYTKVWFIQVPFLRSMGGKKKFSWKHLVFMGRNHHWMVNLYFLSFIRDNVNVYLGVGLGHRHNGILFSNIFPLNRKRKG